MDLSISRTANQSVEANRRLAAPLEAGSQFEAPFCAPPYSPAAVAHPAVCQKSRLPEDGFRCAKRGAKSVRKWSARGCTWTRNLKAGDDPRSRRLSELE